MPRFSINSSRDLEFAKLQATREADAAARGLFEAGATQVIVWDNHNGSLNLHYDDLDRRCDIALGVGFEHRFPGLDDTFSGVVLVGYHAMDNTEDAVIAHSFSSASYQYMKVNGQEVGEMAIDAAMAGAHGVLIICVASDDKGVAESLHDLRSHSSRSSGSSLSDGDTCAFRWSGKSGPRGKSRVSIAASPESSTSCATPSAAHAAARTAKTTAGRNTPNAMVIVRVSVAMP